LAGFGGQAKIDPDLQEWDDGQYEGRRTADIRQARPGWDLFRDGCPGGESVEAVARSVRDLLVPRWLKTDMTDAQANPKQVYDLSMEFLIGCSLTN